MDQTGDDGRAVQAIYVFPFDGVDYSAAVDKANGMGVAVRFAPSRNPEAVRADIAELYGSAAWPQERDAGIVVLYQSGDEDDEDLMRAVDYAMQVDGGIGRLYPKAEQSAGWLADIMDQTGDDGRAVRAVYVFPYDGVDYSAAVAKANRLGVALHFAPGSDDPAAVYDDICAIYGVDKSGNPFR